MKLQDLFEQSISTSLVIDLTVDCDYKLVYKNGDTREKAQSNFYNEILKKFTTINKNLSVDCDYSDKISLSFEIPYREISDLFLEQLIDFCLNYITTKLGNSEKSCIFEFLSFDDKILEALPKSLGKYKNQSIILLVDCNLMTSLKGLQTYPGEIDKVYVYNVLDNKIGLLPLIAAKNIKYFVLYKANHTRYTEIQNILDKYLTSRNILKCQKELINSGFKDYAKI